MANYPNSAPAFTTRNNGDLIDASHPNELGDEITAIGTALLTGLAHGLTTNGQVVFPSSQNASANANTLDDYEEGTYTPTYSGTIGNGTLTGRYTKIGRLVHYEITLVIGSTTTVSGGGLVLGLPFTASGSGPVGGAGLAVDSSAGSVYACVISLISTTTVLPYSTIAAVPGGFATTEPFTWATGDSLGITGTYQAAN